ncbi:MAG: hypothetical protein WCC64_07280 [Aliidongia sp.]
MMTDRFEEELMEDLMAGPETGGHVAMDEFEGSDEFDEADEFEDLAEFEAADEFDEADEMDEAEEEFAPEAFSDEFEDAMADALDADDADEFFGRIGGFLKKVGRGVGSVARVVGPLASMIPLPQAQLIGKAAGLLGNVLADEGDEMDAFDDLADYAEDEDGLDALAPAIAAVAIRSGLKHEAARLPRAQRRELVKTVAAATKHIAHKHGPQAVQALPAIVRHARNVAIRKNLPAKHIPALVARTVRTAVKSPRVLRKLVGASHRLRSGYKHHHGGMARGVGRTRHRGRRGFGGPVNYEGPGGYAGSGRYAGPGRRGGSGRYFTEPGLGVGPRGLGRHRGRGHRGIAGSLGGGTCPGCGRRRTLRFDGPVQVTIEST